MNQRSTRSVLIFLSLISLALLIPNTGFGGAEPCKGTQGFVLPAYFGNLTAQWVSDCGTGPYGCVLMYGNLKSGEIGYKDIIIDKKEPMIILLGTSTVPVTQEAFLNIDNSYLRGMYSFTWQSQCMELSSANNLSYKSETLFTVDVVVMQVK